MTANVLLGDCIEQLAKLEPASVQCCVTSPPYWGLRDYGVDGQIGLEPTPEDYVAKMVEVFRAVWRVLRDDGVLWLNLGDSYANDDKWGGASGGKNVKGEPGVDRARRDTGIPPKNLIGVPWMTAFALRASGWILRSNVIWHKPNPMPEPVTDRPTSAHEHLFLFAKARAYFYNGDAIAEPATSTKPAGNGFKREARESWADRGNETPWQVTETRNARTVWSIPTKPYDGAHFAVFPEELPKRCILAGTRGGDLVLDPFTGSGTTGAVALKLGRRFVGCELNPAYRDLALERMRVTPGFNFEATT